LPQATETLIYSGDYKSVIISIELLHYSYSVFYTLEKRTTFCLGFLLPFIGLICLNLIIDPSGLIRTPQSPLNILVDNRLKKAVSVKYLQPQGIVLGSSTININVQHPGWQVSPVANLFLTSPNIYEIRRYFEHAIAIAPIKQAVIGLDMFEFGKLDKNKTDRKIEYVLITNKNGQKKHIATQLFNAARQWRHLLLSNITTHQSIESLHSIFTDESKPPLDYEKRFFLFLESHLQKGRKELLQSFYKENPFIELHKIIIAAQNNDVELIFVIPPKHATYQEMYHHILGTWENYDDWKRSLVSTIEKTKSQMDKNGTTISLWDFSDCYNFISEKISNDPPMKWFSDPIHSNTNIKYMMQNRIFNVCKEPCTTPDNFGILLTSNNIEQHLLHTRKGQENYRRTHPEEIQFLLDLYVNN